jgi:hypothetical protein
MKALEYIAESEKVIEALGYWPTFHDAELVSFQAERALPVKAGYSVARFAIHVRQYETIGEGTASYEQVLRRNVLIRFVLNEASDFELSGFNHQNVINSLTVSPMQGNEIAGLSVEIESTWGFGGTIQCSSVVVEAVEVLPNAAASQETPDN